MKTIFIVLGTKTRINFILRAPLFNLLKKDGFKVVIITPFWNDQDFVAEFGGPNVVIEPTHPLGRISLTLNFWRTQAMESSHPLSKAGKRIHDFLLRRFCKPPTLITKIKSAIRRTILFLLPDFIKKSSRFWDAVEFFFISKKCADRLFVKYRPSVVVLASAGAEEGDISFLLSCVKRKVPAVVMDTNIDAPETRYFAPPRDAAVYALFGNQTRKLLKEIHNIPEKKMVVTGALRYDYYFREFRPMPREEFFKKIGADSNKKLITFGAKTPLMFPHNSDIINIILNGIKEGKFGAAQLFVRFDTGHDPNLYTDLLPKIIYERMEEMSHREHIANLLYHSDVVISVASTFCIEAMLAGTPRIWIGFDGFHKYATREESTRIHYDYRFMKIFQKGGGGGGVIPLAENPEELIARLEQFLKNKKLNEEERRRVIKEVYFSDDGRTAERIAAIIKKYAG